MSTDAQFELDYVRGICQRGGEIAISLLNDRRLGIDARREFCEVVRCDHVRTARLDVDMDGASGILCIIRIGGEDDGDGLANVADVSPSEDRLTIWIESLDAG